MAEAKPAYLVCGDDDAKIDAWRARLRRRAEEERGAGGLEAFDARSSEPEEVAAALATLSFDPGTRYLLVDDAASWSAGRLGPLQAALANPPPETVLVLLARGKQPPKALSKAVEAAGGEVREYRAPRPRELPRWTSERGRELGLELDREAARALVAIVGQSQQRLSRELEKLALALHPERSASAADVERLASGDAPAQAHELADAVAAGDLPAALRAAGRLEARGERPGRLTFPIVRRLREVHRAARLLEAGMPEQRVVAELDAPPWLAKRTVARATRADRAALERALCAFADLEVGLRGGGESPLDEESAFSLALARAAG